MQIKVKYCNYQNSEYLVFADGRQAKEGDWVLHPFFGGCGMISKVYPNYDMSDYDFVAIDSFPLLLSKGLSVVAVKWKFLNGEDKRKIYENSVFFVIEENGSLKYHEDGKVVLMIE